MKVFPGLTWDMVMNGLSYANLLMLLASLPKYEGMEEEAEEKPAIRVESAAELQEAFNKLKIR